MTCRFLPEIFYRISFLVDVQPYHGHISTSYATLLLFFGGEWAYPSLPGIVSFLVLINNIHINFFCCWALVLILPIWHISLSRTVAKKSTLLSMANYCWLVLITVDYNLQLQTTDYFWLRLTTADYCYRCWLLPARRDAWPTKCPTPHNLRLDHVHLDHLDNLEHLDNLDHLDFLGRLNLLDHCGHLLGQGDARSRCICRKQNGVYGVYYLLAILMFRVTVQCLTQLIW